MKLKVKLKNLERNINGAFIVYDCPFFREYFLNFISCLFIAWICVFFHMCEKVEWKSVRKIIHFPFFLAFPYCFSFFPVAFDIQYYIIACWNMLCYYFIGFRFSDEKSSIYLTGVPYKVMLFLSCCFQDFIFVFDIQHVDYNVSGSLCSYLTWSSPSLKCTLMFSIRFGKCLAIIVGIFFAFSGLSFCLSHYMDVGELIGAPHVSFLSLRQIG